MRKGVILSALVLASCASKASNEERKLAMMQQAGASLGELCEQEKVVVTGWLEDGDTAKYVKTKSSRDVVCARAHAEAIGLDPSSFAGNRVDLETADKIAFNLSQQADNLSVETESLERR